MFGFFEDDKEEKKGDLEKVKAINRSTIEGLSELVQKVTGQAAADTENEAANRRFLDALRREGKGPAL